MPQSRSGVRMKKGCDTCRARKVKCDIETTPPCTECSDQGEMSCDCDEPRASCKECTRLNKLCSWPGFEASLHDQRVGTGSYKSRARNSQLSYTPLVPKAAGTSGGPSEPANEPDTASPMLQISHTGSIMDPSSAFGGSLTDMGYNDEGTLRMPSSLGDGLPPSMESPFPAYQCVGSFEVPSAQDNIHLYLTAQYIQYVQYAQQVQYPSPRSPFVSGHSIPLPNSMELSTEAHQALGHYQTTFSIYRTTKDPKWSTHKLLLDLGNRSEMIMNFILAVAINDVSLRQEHEASLEAQIYFEAGARDLMDMVKRDSEEDFVMAMAGFLFLYWYMPKRKSVPRERIQRLSMTVLSYVKRHKLDSRCLESDLQENENEAPSSLTDRDRPVLARLIIWTFDEDVKCGFQGAGGHLAKYLTAHRERTMAVYEVSRTVLEAYWGTTYPKDQVDDDDYNAMELELLWALTTLWQDINELSQGQFPPPAEAHRRIEQRFSLLEKKYASVFQKSATTTQPRDRVLINADYDVVLFNALKVYYFRVNDTDSSTVEIPPDVQIALTNVLEIIEKTFASKSSDLHDRLQWPLFLAGIETSNRIYRNWIVNNISSRRAREALQQTIDHQSCSGKRLAMSVIKALLCESDMFYPTSLEQNSFLDEIIEPGF
ncbi:uncharacterized protein PAC_16501 [Phialocephala subalpina]|uniref:Zn(2)-C6 fungal-type domain-containing protein n=1 Tax=Phialocephala subalpina TaxID=576137 RepID=A0A1L7XNG3_9HELO|nr:uncharacterized protein PAC_16501 [Phialocephala subalpina]